RQSTLAKERPSSVSAVSGLHSEETGIHQDPVNQSGQYTNNKNEEHDDLLLRCIWLANHRGKQQQEEPANDTNRTKRRQLQRVLLFLPKLVPVVIGQARKPQNQCHSK